VTARRPVTTTNACSNNPVNVAYTFSQFRIAADSAYVATRVLGQSTASPNMCVTLAVDRVAGGWKAIGWKPMSEERCGR
jgi:hypothetical protein